ncbi:hypothetical protein CKM354_001154000 [Cercospora kikuchii]|uniref:Uncharacterized protein n=1 Tax=Cercospora kikuchii TaxID=84275 RepID=A0A9P3FKD0_9PEZI|nr:uncharacterized protein CKM354_001154000 [Cercospora kikuchii]GIZ48482.1 hypothetical protein CKM354_001154000 [Cercospora kikuchii]
MYRPNLTVDCALARLTKELAQTSPLPSTPTTARSINVPATKLTSIAYSPVSKETSDRDEPFDFQALPPELRNKIYHIALTHDVSEGMIPNTALLRTCKQIHDEASLLIEDLGRITLDVEVGEHGTLQVRGNVQGGIKVFDNFSPLAEYSGIFPNYLHRFSKVDISIKLADQDDKDTPSDLYLQTFGAVNRFLLSLADELKSQDRLHRPTNQPRKPTITIKIQSTCLALETRTTLAEDLLYPLAKIPLTYNLSILENSLSAETHDLFAALREHHNRPASTIAPEVHYNLLTQWKLTKTSYLNLQPNHQRIRLSRTAPRRTVALLRLKHFGKACHHLLESVIEDRAIVFSQRSENRVYGTLVTLQRVLQTLGRERQLSVEELQEECEGIEMGFARMVGDKSPLA